MSFIEKRIKIPEHRPKSTFVNVLPGRESDLNPIKKGSYFRN
jgi:hypothetical protein